MSLVNLSKPMFEYSKNNGITNHLHSKLLAITSLDGGSGDYTEKVTSIAGVGSARLHLRPMYRAAQELDLKPRLLSLDVDHPSILGELANPDICVIGKINHADNSRMLGFSMAVLAAVARLKARNTSIALMYCDHLAALNCVRGALYRDLLALSDRVIVPCQAMADRAMQFLTASTPVTVIEDPWQVRMQNFQVPKKGLPLRIVWFGNPNNAVFFAQKIRSLMETIDAVSSIELVALSSNVGLRVAGEAFHQSSCFAVRPWKLQLVLWDDERQPAQLEQVLGSAHVVWLPSEPKSPIKGGVSHNRLVDAVRSGSIVVASNMQSYQELGQIALLGSNHGLLINQLIPQYERLARKYYALRPRALNKFSPEINLYSWRRLLGEMASTGKLNS